jgi:hypothetical protein
VKIPPEVRNMAKTTPRIVKPSAEVKNSFRIRMRKR